MPRWLLFWGVFSLLPAILQRPAIADEPVAKVSSDSPAATDSGARSDSANATANSSSNSSSSAANPAATSTNSVSGSEPSAEGDRRRLPNRDVDQTLLLEVTVNGDPIGKIGEFTLRHGRLLARPAELHDLGFKVPVSRPLETGGLIALTDLPGVTISIDQRNQVLRITAADASLLPTVLQPESRMSLNSPRAIESGTGLTLNYDVTGTFANGVNSAAGSLDMRSFSPWGIASSDWLAYAGASPSGTGKNTAVRLDSAYTYADINTLRRYSLGDFVTGGVSWNRPVHMEGVQIRSDFSMRPDLVTFPLPSIAGSAAVPTTVEVLADGNSVISSQVEAGPFEIPQLPVVSGAGTISMTMTNAQGQQVTVTQPFYASTALLAPGLQTFAIQAGPVRRFWGAESNRYGKMAGSAFYRRGLSSKFTIEGTAEGTPGAFVAGAGGTALVGNLGTLNFAAAVSKGSGGVAGEYSIGAQRIGRVFSIGGSATLATRNFRDVASMNGSGVPRKQISAFAGVSLKRYGSGGVAYAEVDQDAPPVQLQASPSTAQHSHVVTANYSLQFRRFSIFATEFKNIGGDSGNRSNGFQAGVTIPLGRRRSMAVSGSSDGNWQVQAQQSAAQVGEWGYQAYVSAGNGSHGFGVEDYKSPVGLFSAGVDSSGDQTTVRVESQAAVSYVDRGVFPSNTIYDSFAIVDTAPLPGVHVLQENRQVGKTSGSGRLLVPDMRAFDVNHIAIDANDIPADASFNNPDRVLRPQDRSGVVIRFPIQFSHGALLKLVDETGAPIPLGSAATLRATGTTVPVGYDGDAYLEGLSAHNEVAVERKDGKKCAVVFDYRPVAREIPSIGPLRCAVQEP